MNKVLVLEGRESIGGGQIVTKFVCESLRDNLDVSVFLPGNKESQLANLLNDYEEYYFNQLPYSYGKKDWKDYIKLCVNVFSVSIALVKTLNKVKPSLLYVQNMRILPIICFLNIVYGIPVVAHIHVVFIDTKVRWLVNKLLRSKYVVKIVGVSEYALKQLSPFNKAKCTVVYNAVNKKKEVKHLSVIRNIAIIGDVYPLKGHDVLFKAVSISNMNLRIHVVGKVIDRKYKKYLDETYPNVLCVYTGLLDNVESYLCNEQIDLTVIPSISPFETFSLAMVESWAQNIPTIATNDYGMRELVRTFLPEYSNMMLFNKGNAYDLLDKINNLCNSKEMYDKICNAVLHIVEEQLNVATFKDRIRTIVANEI